MPRLDHSQARDALRWLQTATILGHEAARFLQIQGVLLDALSRPEPTPDTAPMPQSSGHPPEEDQ